jgi:hypothetical protein
VAQPAAGVVLVGQALLQVVPFDILHHNIVVGAVLEVGVDLWDGRVAQGRERPGLGLVIGGQIDRAHAAF